MKNVVVSVMILAGGLVGAPIITAPIEVSGSGWFVNVTSSAAPNRLQFSFSGSNGVDTVSVDFARWFALPPHPLAFTSIGAQSSLLYPVASARLNDLQSPIFDVFVGNGTGRLNIYDTFTRAHLASIDLIGFVNIQSVGPGLAPGDIYGTYSVTATNMTHAPEPATFLLMLIALVFVGLAHYYGKRIKMLLVVGWRTSRITYLYFGPD